MLEQQGPPSEVPLAVPLDVCMPWILAGKMLESYRIDPIGRRIQVKPPKISRSDFGGEAYQRKGASNECII